MFKYLDKQVVLRFEAFFVKPCAEDAVRKFTIQFHLNDETLTIQEHITRNSGVLGGKFLRRDKHKHRDGSYIVPTDCLPGKTCVINSHDFLVTGCDGATKKYLKENEGIDIE